MATPDTEFLPDDEAPVSNPDMDLLRRFAGADPTADDAVLQLCLDSAKNWYSHAGVAEQTTQDYKLWVCNLAAWFYDNRGATGPEAEVPPFIVSSVHQLREAP